MVRLWDHVVLDDTRIQGSKVTILLTLYSRFSAFIGFPGVESLWGFTGVS